MTTFGECLSELFTRTQLAFPYDPEIREKLLWDVILALRGPDDCPELKPFTAARIRGILGMDKGLGPMVRSLPLRDIEVQRRDWLLSTHSEHYEEHFERAMRGLHLLGYVVPFYERYVGRLPGPGRRKKT